jgi:transposase-like protein
MIEEGRVCPKCGSKEKQAKDGFTNSGTQRCRCFNCKCRYALNPKSREYPEEVRRIAIKEYYAGISGRGVGKIHGMSGNNVINWIKKNRNSVDK